MKVKILKTTEDQEEYAVLYLHEYTPPFQALAQYIEGEQYDPAILLCYQGDVLHRIASTDIYYIESNHEIQTVYTENGIYETKRRLYELEDFLPHQFVRISKSAILNLSKVKLYKPMLNGLMQAELLNSKVTYISRKYLKEIKHRIKEGL